MSRDPGLAHLHHSDIVTYALSRLASDYARSKTDVLNGLRRSEKAAATLRTPVSVETASMPMRALRDSEKGDG